MKDEPAWLKRILDIDVEHVLIGFLLFLAALAIVSMVGLFGCASPPLDIRPPIARVN